MMITGPDDAPTYAISSYTVRPTGFTDVIHPDKDNWCLIVADAGDGWAIRRANMCLNYRNEWEYEPRPGIRDPAFLRRCRFNEHAALLRSKRVIDTLEFDGQTFEEFAAQVLRHLLDKTFNDLEHRRQSKMKRGPESDRHHSSSRTTGSPVPGNEGPGVS